MTPTAPNQLWVSDITYWKIKGNKHLYLTFITDAYYHKILRYQAAETLEAIESVQALQMALSAFGRAESHLKNLIHHSDRGVQYCSREYVKILQDYKIQISMTEKGDPLENAIAERINGIIKEEYVENYNVKNLCQAKESIAKAVELYNTDRPHMSIGNLTPNKVHESNTSLKTKKMWKNYYKKTNTHVNQY